MNNIEINSFEQIDIKHPNTLVICDIDDTLLYFPGMGPKKYNEILSHYMSLCFQDFQTASEYTSNYWEKLFLTTEPMHTDKLGFYNLLYRLNENNSGLCFLTARPGHESNIEYTRQNFKSLNLNYDEFVVFYSHKTPKGEYIKTSIDVSKYTNIIFIDDLNQNLSNVKLTFGDNVQCYKFKHNFE